MSIQNWITNFEKKEKKKSWNIWMCMFNFNRVIKTELINLIYIYPPYQVIWEYIEKRKIVNLNVKLMMIAIMKKKT